MPMQPSFVSSFNVYYSLTDVCSCYMILFVCCHVVMCCVLCVVRRVWRHHLRDSSHSCPLMRRMNVRATSRWPRYRIRPALSLMKRWAHIITPLKTVFFVSFLKHSFTDKIQKIVKIPICRRHYSFNLTQ